ncbi:MAG: 50S ribosomal protein L24 [Bdellovibrionota bacterium]
MVKQSRANKKIKVGDTVQVISGKESAAKKTGKVLRIIPKFDSVIVEKVNLVKKHQKPTQDNPQGGIKEIEAPIHLSNVKLISASPAGSKEKVAKKTETKTKKATKKTAAKEGKK